MSTIVLRASMWGPERVRSQGMRPSQRFRDLDDGQLEILLRVADTLDLVRKGEQHIAGRFAVVQPGRVRIRRVPGD